MRHRRQGKYSDGLNEKFLFFLKSYRAGILQFCGEDVRVSFSHEGLCAKEGFKQFENGYYSRGKNEAVSYQPRVMEAVIRGKKAWGLWLDQWTDGIAEWSFTTEEILAEFEKAGIVIPQAFVDDFHNRLQKKKDKRNEDYSLTLKRQQ